MEGIAKTYTPLNDPLALNTDIAVVDIDKENFSNNENLPIAVQDNLPIDTISDIVAATSSESNQDQMQIEEHVSWSFFEES